MRALLAAALLAFLTLPAHAVTCEDVRQFVATHSQEEIEQAKKQMTPAQVRLARRCLKGN